MPQLMANTGIRDYLRIVFYRKWWIAGILLISMAIAFSYVASAERIYRSYSLIRIEDKLKSSRYLEGITKAPTLGEMLLPMNIEIKSRKTMQRMMLDIEEVRRGVDIEQIEIDPNDGKKYPKIVDPGAFKGKADSISGSLSIDPRGQYIQVTFDDTSFERAQKIVNWMTNEFIQLYDEILEDEVSYATAYLEKELEIYQERVHKSEKELKNYNRIMDLEFGGTAEDFFDQINRWPTSTSSAMTTLTSMYTNRRQLESQIIENEKTAETIQQQLRGEKKMVRAQVTREYTPEAEQVLAKISELSFQLSELKLSRTEEHPLVQARLRELKRLQDHFATLDNKFQSVTVDEANPLRYQLTESLNTLLAQTEGLKASLKKNREDARVFEEKIKQMPERELQFIRKRMDHSVNMRMLSMLHDRLQIAQITKQAEQAETGRILEIYEEAAGSKDPIKPNLQLVFLLALMVGGLVSSMVIFFLEYADHSIRGIEDVKRHFDYPVLGAISDVRAYASSKSSDDDKQGFWGNLTVKLFKKGKQFPASLWLLVALLMIGLPFVWAKVTIGAKTNPEKEAAVLPETEPVSNDSQEEIIPDPFTGPGAYLSDMSLEPEVDSVPADGQGNKQE